MIVLVESQNSCQNCEFIFQGHKGAHGRTGPQGIKVTGDTVVQFKSLYFSIRPQLEYQERKDHQEMMALM